MNLNRRTLNLNSQSQIAFVYSKKEDKIIPVLMLTGIKSLGTNPEYIYTAAAAPEVGIINENSQFFGADDGSGFKIQEEDWLILNEQNLNNYVLVYPRIIVKESQIYTTEDNLIVRIAQSNSFKTLEQYKDYSVLLDPIKEQYLITLDSNIILKNNYLVTNETDNFKTFPIDQRLFLDYITPNHNTTLYLDALDVSTENAYPQISYNVKINFFNNNFINNFCGDTGTIVQIYDKDLKFSNVRGYVSETTLDLDNPDNDNISIKNYKTKFEDLLTTMTVQTQAMKKSSGTIHKASVAFTESGTLSENILQDSLENADLDYNFNQGKLSITEEDGIIGLSDNGAISIRNQGIFTAREKQENGSWKWTSAITPTGINANLIKTGQLDTNLIKIYAGDHVRFQMNGDGIFAYKNKINIDENISYGENNEQSISPQDSIDEKQYVLFNDNGLSLIAKKGAKIPIKTNNQLKYYTVLDNNDIITKENATELLQLNEITRVEVSWRGLILRNWSNEEVFFADPQTGDLTLKGHISATSGTIGGWNIDVNKLWAKNESIRLWNGTTITDTYVALNVGSNDEDTNTTTNTAPYVFWAGHQNPQQANFFIRRDGQFYAKTGMIDCLYTPLMTLAEGETKQVIVQYRTAGNFTPKQNGIPYNVRTILQVHNENNPSDILFSIDNKGHITANDIYIMNYSSSGHPISLQYWMRSVQQQFMS